MRACLRNLMDTIRRSPDGPCASVISCHAAFYAELNSRVLRLSCTISLPQSLCQPCSLLVADLARISYWPAGYQLTIQSDSSRSVRQRPRMAQWSSVLSQSGPVRLRKAAVRLALKTICPDAKKRSENSMRKKHEPAEDFQQLFQTPIKLRKLSDQALHEETHHTCDLCLVCAVC